MEVRVENRYTGEVGYVGVQTDATVAEFVHNVCIAFACTVGDAVVRVDEHTLEAEDVSLLGDTYAIDADTAVTLHLTTVLYQTKLSSNLEPFAGMPLWVRQSKDCALLAVRRNGLSLHLCGTAANDPDVVLAAVEQNETSFRFASTSIRSDQDMVVAAMNLASSAVPAKSALEEALTHGVVRRAVAYNGEVLKCVPQRFREDRDFVAELLKLTPQAASLYKHLPLTLRADPDLASAAVVNDRRMLEYVPPLLRDDVTFINQSQGAPTRYSSLRHMVALRGNRDVVLKEITRCSAAFSEASNELRENREFIVDAVTANGDVLRYLNGYGDDRDMVMRAVRSNGGALQGASARLRDDKEVVMEAVRQFGRALMFASTALRGDPDVVRAANCAGGGALCFASEALQHDPSFVRIIVTEVPDDLSTSPFRYNRDMILAACSAKKATRALLCDVPSQLSDDREFVKQTLWSNGMNLKHASRTLKRDTELVALAVKEQATAFRFAGGGLRGEVPFVEKVCGQNGMALQYVEHGLLSNRAVVEAAVKSNGLAITYAHSMWWGDATVALLAVTQCAKSFLYLDNSLQHCPAFTLRALRANPAVFPLLPPHMLNEDIVAAQQETKEELPANTNTARLPNFVN